MIVIVEGPDRVGKDTLIENMRKEYSSNAYSVHVLHYGRLKGSNEEIQKASKSLYSDMFALLSNADNFARLFICNRAHLGEAVYGPIYRNYSGDYVFDIESHFENICRDAYLIVLTDNPENLLKREDGASFGKDVEAKQMELDNFSRAYNKSNIRRKILINIAGKTPEQVFAEVKNFFMETR